MRFIFLFLILFVSLSAPAHAADRETAYDRVMRTGVIRCGYIIWPPFLDKDLKAGAFKGMNYDYMEALADSLGLKVEWASEVTNGLQVEALRTGKIDAICSAEGPFVPRTARYLFYSEPLAYFPSVFYARPDDRRFDNNIDAINQPDVRIVTIDGDSSYEITKAQFPKAISHNIPQISPSGQMMMEVITGKADLLITDALTIAGFLKENPGALREVKLPKPVAVIPNTFSVLQAPGGLELVTLINQGMRNLRHFGKEDYIFKQYMADIGTGIFRVAKPYEVKN
jgi:ABC-type amino acid transport substrate-binding protein